jgi:hypothetical protein
MTSASVKSRLARLEQIGVRPAGVPLCMLPDLSGLYSEWSDATEAAELAWIAWKDQPGPDAYSVYRAAADREDCAQRRLAEHR